MGGCPRLPTYWPSVRFPPHAMKALKRLLYEHQKSLNFNDSVSNFHKFTELYLIEQFINILPWVLSPQDAVQYCPPNTNPLDLLFLNAKKALVWFSKVPPPTMYLRITVQIHVRSCWKHLTFPNYDFGKGQYASYPIKLSRSGEKKIKFVRNTKISDCKTFTTQTFTTPDVHHLRRSPPPV